MGRKEPQFREDGPSLNVKDTSGIYLGQEHSRVNIKRDGPFVTKPLRWEGPVGAISRRIGARRCRRIIKCTGSEGYIHGHHGGGENRWENGRVRRGGAKAWPQFIDVFLGRARSQAYLA